MADSNEEFFYVGWNLSCYKVKGGPKDSHKVIRIPHEVQDAFIKVVRWHDEGAKYPALVVECDQPTDYEPLEAVLDSTYDVSAKTLRAGVAAVAAGG